MHMTRMHAQRCQVREFVPTAACPVCHKWYHQRLRAVYHVTHTPACREVAESGALPRLDADALAALPAEHRLGALRLAHSQRAPSCRSQN